MPIWKAGTVAQEASTTLVRWQIMQYADGQRSFVGYAVESREVRVSSAVATFDVEALRGVTQSGRVYQLQGKPGLTPTVRNCGAAGLRAKKHRRGPMSLRTFGRSTRRPFKRLTHLSRPSSSTVSESTMRKAERKPLWARVELTEYAQAKLGVKEWGLLHSYGKLMTGPPLGGLYVSGIPCEVAKKFVDAFRHVFLPAPCLP